MVDATSAHCLWRKLSSSYKYVVCIPFLVQAGVVGEGWCLYMLLLAFLRYLQSQLWISFCRLPCVSNKFQIASQGIEFGQIDLHHDWDNHIILQAVVATAAHACVPGWKGMPFWGRMHSFLFLLLMHCGPVELLHYCFHRALHSNDYLFHRFHSRHHAFLVTEPCTGGACSWMEQAVQTALMSMAVGITFAVTGPSVSILFSYCLVFDFLNSMAHCNVEVMPASVYHAFPPLKFLLLTPSYHSLHHTRLVSNFCLFMPVYDKLGGTRDAMTDQLYCSSRTHRQQSCPDFVFLAHCIDVLSSPHVSFVYRTLASHPYSPAWFLWPTWPICFLAMLLLWAFGRTFVACSYLLDNSTAIQTWIVPRYGFHYLVPFQSDSINKLIEGAILDADKAGVKVVSLAALNKNEALNGGGALFVKKHPHLRVRLVHGNTLTAAVVVHAIPPHTHQVFLTGSTSKLGRAIALYLSRRGVLVLMMTRSKERFDGIVAEAAPEHRHRLLQVAHYQAGQHCKTWIVGKWMSAQEQQWAPPATHFHQFAIPAVTATRKDCSYGNLAGLRLPLHRVRGLNSCELTMPRGAVHACHAGGLLHVLEGWQHHEVGNIEVDRMDVAWNAALRHGFTTI